MNSQADFGSEIADLERRLEALDRERAQVAELLNALQRQQMAQPTTSPRPDPSAAISVAPSNVAKIALFRSLFRGRDDVFPRRWENPKTGKAGYAPACRNEWRRGLCGKPKVKCGECPNQAFLPLDDQALRSHLRGREPGRDQDFTPVSMPCAPMRRAGSSPPISTRNHGWPTSPPFATPHAIWRCRSRLSVPAPAMAPTPGSFSPNLCRRPRRGGWGRCWSPGQWNAVPISASSPTTAFSPARTPCRPGASAI